MNPSGVASSGGFGHAVEQLLAPRLGGRQLLLERLQLLLHPFELARAAPASAFPSPSAPRAAPRRAAARSRTAASASSSSSNSSAAPLRASAARSSSGSFACLAQVDHRAKNASSTCATPSSSTEGQTKSATSFTRSCAFATATPYARPVDELDVVLAVAERDGALAREAKVLREEVEPGRLRDVRRRELEEVRQRLRDVEAAVEARDHALLQPVEHLGIVDHDELRRRFVEPVEQVADGVQLEMLEVRVAASLRRDLGDVELVVDVAVESEALVVDRGDRLARELERDRDVPQPACR